MNLQQPSCEVPPDRGQFHEHLNDSKLLPNCLGKMDALVTESTTDMNIKSEFDLDHSKASDEVMAMSEYYDGALNSINNLGHLDPLAVKRSCGLEHEKLPLKMKFKLSNNGCNEEWTVQNQSEHELVNGNLNSDYNNIKAETASSMFEEELLEIHKESVKLMLAYQAGENLGSDKDGESPESSKGTMDNGATSESDIKELEGKRAKPFKCSQCQYSFTHPSQLKIHERVHTGEKPYKCDECGVAFARTNCLKAHKRSHTGEKPFKCELCGQTFTRSNSLTKHRRIHTGEKPYKCPYCDSAFIHNGSLKAHIRTHTGEKPYVCKICGDAFAEYNTLKGHYRRHTGEKPYKCEICDSRFSQMYAYKTHLKTHSGEKPFVCTLCNAAFGKKYTLTSHMWTHSGEKRFKCDICDARFGSSSNLKNHVRTHTGEKPYICNICSKAFAHSTSLQTHARTHSGIKPFKCDYCGHAFTQQSGLKTHIRTHTGEKPYVCPVPDCDGRFTQAKHLRQHLQKYHPNAEPVDTKKYLNKIVFKTEDNRPNVLEAIKNGPMKKQNVENTPDQDKAFDETDQDKAFNDADQDKAFDDADQDKAFDDADQDKAFDDADQDKAFNDADQDKAFNEEKDCDMNESNYTSANESIESVKEDYA